MIIKSGVRTLASFGARFADIVEQGSHTDRHTETFLRGKFQCFYRMLVAIENVVFILANSVTLEQFG